MFKSKNSYGVDVITEIYNDLTKVIEKRLNKTGLMVKQETKWYETTNLAIYKEDFGIIPVRNFLELETAVDRQIPLDNDFETYYYGYIFIMPKKDGSPVPYSGDYKNYDKFMLTVRNGDFVLEKFNEETIAGDQMAKDDQKEKINLLKKENEELMDKKQKLASDVKEEIELEKAQAKLKQQTIELEKAQAKLKQQTKELNAKKTELNAKKTELNAKKTIDKLEEEIKNLKTYIEYNSTVKETAEAIKKSGEIADLSKLIEEKEKKINANVEPSPEGNTGGFLIEEKNIGGEIYLTFSVSEYLEKMIKSTEKPVTTTNGKLLVLLNEK